MKAQHVRPRAQQRPIARRRSTYDQSLARTSDRAAHATRRRSKGKTEEREHGSRVFWLMVLAGGVLTTGFLLGLRSQIAARQLNQAEERLKDEFDRYASQRKFLSLEQQRALSPRESERAVKEAGLAQLKFDKQSALAALPVRFDAAKNATANKIAARPATGKAPAVIGSKEQPAAKDAKKAKAASKQNVVKTSPGKGSPARNALNKPAKTQTEKSSKTKKERNAPKTAGRR
jgi:hypothetical protein